MTRRTIALLGGGGLGPWAWERVSASLDARGFRTITPQLRGTGDDPTPTDALSLDSWIGDLRAALSDLNANDLVLVAHSFAGLVAAGLIEQAPFIAEKVVFLDAVLPESGRSRFQTIGADAEKAMRGSAVDGAIPFFTRAQIEALHPGHGIGISDWDWMQPRLRSVPIAMFAEPAISRPLDPLKTSLAYVRCLKAPPMANIDDSSAGWTYRTLNTGHWPMITDPTATVEIIAEVSSK